MRSKNTVKKKTKYKAGTEVQVHKVNSNMTYFKAITHQGIKKKGDSNLRSKRKQFNRERSINLFLPRYLFLQCSQS